MIEQALTLYRQRVARARLDDWPEVYACHFAGDRLLGELQTQVSPLVGPAESVYWLMMPLMLGVEVTASVCLFEAYTAPVPHPEMLEADRVLYATSVVDEGDGIRTTHYVIGYTVLEGGIRLYDTPEKRPLFVPKLNEAIGTLLDHRSKRAVYSYDEAVAVAIEAAK